MTFILYDPAGREAVRGIAQATTNFPSSNSPSSNLDTYYVYDGLGQLRAVLPPVLAHELLTGSTLSTEERDIFAYLYQYDNRGNCIAKKLPGCAWTRYAYDVIVPLNAALFEWVIENLSKNAVDAMGGEGGTITLHVEQHDNKTIIDVSDTGKGIPKKDVKNVFRPGFTTKKRGWGLGLSLAKRIVEEYHHGKIYVRQSEVGKGTTFRIELETTLPRHAHASGY